MSHKKAWLILTAILLSGLIPFVLLALARQKSSEHTRIALIQDMGRQPKYGPQSQNSFFPDGRAMRAPVKDTVPRGELAGGDALNLGIANDAWLTLSPVPVTPELLSRGKECFEIFCACCHGLDGNGDGLVAARAAELAKMQPPSAFWTAPANLHLPDVRSRPAGWIFSTISNGIRTMPPYSAQIDAVDRWAIIAHVRVLQQRDQPVETLVMVRPESAPARAPADTRTAESAAKDNGTHWPKYFPERKMVSYSWVEAGPWERNNKGGLIFYRLGQKIFSRAWPSLGGRFWPPVVGVGVFEKDGSTCGVSVGNGSRLP